MRGWQRPYSVDLATGSAMLGLVGVAGFGVFLGILYVRGHLSAPMAVLCGVWLAAALAVTARRAVLGVYVSDGGLRTRSLLRTITLPWESVAAIRSGTASIGGLDMGRTAIVIERADGVLIQTPLQRGDVFRPFTFRPELGRLATWPEHYDEILATLRAHHRDAQRRRPAASAAQLPLPPPGVGSTSPTDGVTRTPAPHDAVSADQRRDIHTLIRQHQRGALSDAEFAVELAKIRGTG
ncbi:PH domain-containing protein [Micromonospora sp. NPDC051006]|uniref:PH domain-containing protein n=1 Tax=Micromonospora sp. NPDC051006 TaxID=3364283 RepID=UPI003792C770